MKRRLVFAALLPGLCASLAGCEWNWDSATGQFDDYKAFAADRVHADPLLPEALVPKSARAIRIKIVMDMNEVFLDFDFAPADKAALLAGFQLLPAPLKARFDKERWFEQHDASASVYRRCSAETVEFLAISNTGHAHYQSTQYPDYLGPYCANATSASQ
jgi:hypothetical protein